LAVKQKPLRKKVALKKEFNLQDLVQFLF